MKKIATLLFLFFALFVSFSCGNNPQENVDVGAQTYQQRCSRCHGIDGKGSEDAGAMELSDLTDPKVQDKMTDEQMKEIIINGREKMPPLKGVSEQDLSKLIKHVRSLKK